MVPVHDPCGWSVVAGGRLYGWLRRVSIRFEAHYWTVTSLVIGIGVLWMTSLLGSLHGSSSSLPKH